MDNSIYIIIAVIVFFIIPLISIYIAIKSYFETRSAGKELDFISNSLNRLIDGIHVSDLAEFDGDFSNWLEINVPKSKTRIAKSSLQLLTYAKFVGLGESHRERLVTHKDYRRKALRYSKLLADAYKYGEPQEIYFSIGKLYELFYCKGNQKGKKLAQSHQHIMYTIDALIFAAENLEKDFDKAQKTLSQTLKKVVTLGSEESDLGFSLLILRWALINISKPNKYEKSFFQIRNKSVSYHLNQVALHYKNNDLGGVVHEISQCL